MTVVNEKANDFFFFWGGGEGGGVVQKPKRYRESPKTAYLTPEWYENHLPSLFYGRTPPPYPIGVNAP